VTSGDGGRTGVDETDGLDSGAGVERGVIIGVGVTVAEPGRACKTEPCGEAAALGAETGLLAADGDGETVFGLTNVREGAFGGGVASLRIFSLAFSAA
jgi:hypothetical protein